MGYIYLLESANEDGTIYKIGYTKNSVQKRIRSLQTGNPYLIKELYCFQTKYNQRLEKSLHNFYSHCRLNGEWFKMSITDINNFTSLCDKLETNFDNLKNNHFISKMF